MRTVGAAACLLDLPFVLSAAPPDRWPCLSQVGNLGAFPCFGLWLDCLRRPSCLLTDWADGSGKMKLSLVAAVLLLLGAARAEEEDKKEDVGTVVGIDLGTTYSW